MLVVKQLSVVLQHYLLGALFEVKPDHKILKLLSTQDAATFSDWLHR
jgi:hypothetical protein